MFAADVATAVAPSRLGRRRRMKAPRSLPGVRDLYRLGRDTLARYGRLGGSQFAAAISYRALFSLVPLATFAAMVLATVLEGNDAARQDVVDAISGAHPAQRRAERSTSTSSSRRSPRRGASRGS